MPSAGRSVSAFSWCSCWFQLNESPNNISRGEPPRLAFTKDNEWKQTLENGNIALRHDFLAQEACLPLGIHDIGAPQKPVVKPCFTQFLF